MLKFDYEGKKVEVVFVHQRKTKIRKRSFTVCAIYVNEEQVTGGCTYCSPKDNFNHNTGRKIALARALKNEFDGDEHKAFRTLVWQKYFEARNGRKE